MTRNGQVKQVMNINISQFNAYIINLQRFKAPYSHDNYSQ